MGLWAGRSTSIHSKQNVVEKEMKIAQRIARREALKARLKAGARFAGREAADVAIEIRSGAIQTARDVGGAGARQAVGFEVGRAVAVAQRQTVDFSSEQRMLQEMFGGGPGTFWNLPDSETGVQIHNDLNPSKRGDYRTQEIFGLGGRPMPRGERSGLF